MRIPFRLPDRGWLPVVLVPAILLASFAVAAGWLSPARLRPDQVVDALEANSGIFPGHRRNHAKGVCVTGHFQSSGAAARYSRATLFRPGRTPFVGRFSTPGGVPHAPDAAGPVRSLALSFHSSDGQTWRTGMNNAPVFAVSTPEAFYRQVMASRPDPATGKPDPKRQEEFFAAHPETAAFRAWARATRPSDSYATETYNGLNAFFFIDADDVARPVRWKAVPANSAASTPPGGLEAGTLEADLSARLARAPLQWRLQFVLGTEQDPTHDATRAWPDARPVVEAGVLIMREAQPQATGECRDVNFDPAILPDGIEASDDPLIAARSAVYAGSFLRRMRETAARAHTP